MKADIAGWLSCLAFHSLGRAPNQNWLTWLAPVLSLSAETLPHWILLSEAVHVCEIGPFGLLVTWERSL